MSQPVAHRPLAEPFSTGPSWLSRALSVSVLLHALVGLVWWQATARSTDRRVELVDIEMAPPPPRAEALPAEVARPPEPAPEVAQASAAVTPPPLEPGEDNLLAAHDAGVDAPVDAPVDASPVDARPKRPRPDAAIADAAIDAQAMHVAALDELDGGMTGGDAGAELAQAGGDAGADLGSDGGVQVAAIETGTGGSGTTTGAGVPGDGSGVPGATQTGSGSGIAGVDNQPAVDGAPTTAGTAANLIAYFPPGHQVTALIRFDRLRDTEWARPTERLLRPMPDYHALFGARDARLASKFDTLVISSPRPRDATATTLVVRTSLARPQLRDYLANRDTPITWTVAKGGMYGTRSGKLFPGDKRVLLSPWKSWIVLAPPADLAGLTTPMKGKIDTVETKAKLPPWLDGIRAIEKESGDDTRGPALVLTIAGPGTRLDIPDIGIGVTSLPSPQRLSLAAELVPQGWLVRGNIVFASEAEAIEFATAVEEVQQRVVNSRVLSALLRRQHALNLVKGLSLARTEARVSYATSLSIADARALLTAAAATLDSYFAGTLQPTP